MISPGDEGYEEERMAYEAERMAMEAEKHNVPAEPAALGDPVSIPLKKKTSSSTQPGNSESSKPQGEPLRNWLNSLPRGGTFRTLLPGDEGYAEARMAMEAERQAVQETPAAMDGIMPPNSWIQLNVARRTVIFAGVAIVVLMGLFPPWTLTFSSGGTYSEESGGYSSIMSPPSKKEESPRHGVKLDISRLLIQWAMAVAVTGLGVLVAGPRKDTKKRLHKRDILNHKRELLTKSQTPRGLANANETTLDNVSAMAAAYLREKELGETGAFEKAYKERVGKNHQQEKEDILKEVVEALKSQEQTIRGHPLATGKVYRKGRDAFVSGDHTAIDEPWARAADLTLEEITLLRRYMLSSSFISAWYHVQGEKAHRDKTANSCAGLVAGCVEDPEQVMRQYLDYERLWRRVMKAEGLTPSRWRTPSALALAYPLAAGIWLSSRGAPPVEAIGYGVTQLGYLVAFSGLVFGSFQILSIGTRWKGFALGVAFWILGVVIVNL